MRGVATGYYRQGQPWTLVLCLALAGWGAALQQDAASAFANLTVVAFGDQEVDILTGITTLPDGGRLIDREHDLTLSASWMRFLEGDFVEAKEVEISGEFGVVSARAVTIDLAAEEVRATGAVRYEGPEWGIDAQAISYSEDLGLVVFEGPIRGEGIALEASAALFDVPSGTFLLAAPYRYADGPLELTSERPGALLSLQPLEGRPGELVASNRIEPQLLERVRPHLPE